jgi:hypothetical protein
MKVTFKAIVTSVSEVRTTDNGTKVASIYAMIPGYTNEFGEKVGKDEVFEIRMLNKLIETYEKELFGKNFKDEQVKPKCMFTCYLNSQPNESNGKVWYNLNLTLSKMELLNK